MIHWNRRKYTKEQFINAWNTSATLSEVASKIGCNRSGGGYHTIKSAATELALSYDHMTGKANSGPKFRRTIEEKLVNGILLGTNGLKLDLIKNNLLENKCQECGLPPLWNNRKLVLQLDHINGVRTDNRLENLRLLCPNCHTQTITYGGKNRKQKYNGPAENAENNVCSCGKVISRVSITCQKCWVRKSKIDWPPIKYLLDRVALTNYTVVGQELGVTGNAVKKHIRHKC